MNRRQVLAIGVFASAMPLSGCFTSRLNRNTSYNEKINGFFISSDKKIIAIVGAKYHYVFDAPSELLAALDPILHPAINQATFSNFRVDRDNRITGDIKLYTISKLSTQQKELAERAGFNSTNSNMWAGMQLSGTRYLAKESESPVVQRLNREYFVAVEEEPSIAGKTLRVAATPITVAADGAVILGAVVLSPIWLPIVLTNVCWVCK